MGATPVTGPDPAPFPDAADRSVPPADSDLRTAWRWSSAAVVAGCCLVVLWVLDPQLLVRNTTPNGGDLGAHVWFPAFLRDHLLPDWRVAGWSNDWFGGFPAGQFYFPVPALVTVALDVLLPYNIALKLTTAIGPVLMPAGAYAFGRGIRARRPAPELFAVATVFFLFFKGISAGVTANSAESAIQFNQRIMGGTLVSALAGEYAFSFALATGLFALGAIAFSVRTGRRVWLAVVLLALTVFSHLVVGLFVGAGAVVVTGIALTRRSRWRSVSVAAVIASVAAMLTAFWTLPLVATFTGYTQNMRYTKIETYLDYLVIDEFTWIYILAIVGLALAIAFRDRAGITVALMACVWALVFRFWPELHAWNLRFLPFWYLTVFFLAAFGVAEVVRRLSGEFARLWVGPAPDETEAYEYPGPRERRVYRSVMSASTLAVVGVITVTAIWFNFAHRDFIPYWVSWNETGYENAAQPRDPNAKANSRKQYSEYKALIDRMGKLPPGRALWEGGPSIDVYGTPLALMLLPYWTDGRIQSFEGLYYESAASTPFVFMAISPLSATENSSDPVRGLDYLDLDRFEDGVRYLRALGGRYYMAHSESAKTAAAASPGLRFIDTVQDRDAQAPESWDIYEVRRHALVAPLRNEPVVVSSRAKTQAECFGRDGGTVPGPKLGAWECTGVGWWSDVENLAEPLAASGPASWRRATTEEAPGIPRRRLPKVEVTDIVETDNNIRFRVSRPGVPVVVRTSYYPNWEVTSGAQGPWRLTPNLMVVVPTERSVHLHFARSSAEKGGGLITLAGLAALTGLVIIERRRGFLLRFRPGGNPDIEQIDPLSGPASPTEAAAEAGDTMTVPPPRR